MRNYTVFFKQNNSVFGLWVKKSVTFGSWVLTNLYVFGMNEKTLRKKVFVVDDDFPSYQLIEELFSEYQVILRHFITGQELMQRFEKELPDLIIMDVQLPDIDGLELTRQIKSAEPSLPVIAYTSYAMPGDRDRCLEAGCDEYMSKPIDLDVFFEVVNDFLSD